MNKVLIIVGDATETVDTLYPYYRLQEDGFEPVVAGPETRRYHMVLHEIPPDWDGQVTREFEGYTINADVAFKDVNPDEYLGIFFSGGRAPEYIRYDPDLVRITKHFFEMNKPIACVCHGVEIPAYAGCVKGRKMAVINNHHTLRSMTIQEIEILITTGGQDHDPVILYGNVLGCSCRNTAFLKQIFQDTIGLGD